MAEKDTDRDYVIPLRREFLKVPKYKRAKKAITAIKQFLLRHTKKDVKIGKYLNQKIWQNGIKNPPHHVRVSVKSDEEGNLTAELFGIKTESEEKEKKTPKQEEKKKEDKPEKRETDKKEKSKKTQKATTSKKKTNKKPKISKKTGKKSKTSSKSKE